MLVFIARDAYQFTLIAARRMYVRAEVAPSWQLIGVVKGETDDR
jgi:hypothetical protein